MLETSEVTIPAPAKRRYIWVPNWLRIFFYGGDAELKSHPEMDSQTEIGSKTPTQKGLAEDFGHFLDRAKYLEPMISRNGQAGKGRVYSLFTEKMYSNVKRSLDAEKRSRYLLAKAETLYRMCPIEGFAHLAAEANWNYFSGKNDYKGLARKMKKIENSKRHVFSNLVKKIDSKKAELREGIRWKDEKNSVNFVTEDTKKLSRDLVQLENELYGSATVGVLYKAAVAHARFYQDREETHDDILLAEKYISAAKDVSEQKYDWIRNLHHWVGVIKKSAELRQSHGTDSKILMIRVDSLERNDTSYLSRAFDGIAWKYPEAKLLVVGEKKEDFARLNLILDSIRPEFRDRVMTATVEGDNMAQYYKSSDVFILPNCNEKLRTAALESMLMGTPVIMNESHPYVDSQYAYGVRVGNAKRMADLLVYLFENPAIARGNASLVQQAVKGSVIDDPSVRNTVKQYASAMLDIN